MRARLTTAREAKQRVAQRERDRERETCHYVFNSLLERMRESTDILLGTFVDKEKDCTEDFGSLRII